MKGFLRSKLILSLAAIVMVAAALSAPLSGSFNRLYAAGNVNPTLTKLSSDETYHNKSSQHKTEVEPDSFHLVRRSYLRSK